jgi:hypothetical protein
MRVIAFETITVDNTVKTLTLASYDPATIMLSGDVVASPAVQITAEGGDMRYRLDGTNPTTSVGHLLKTGDLLKLRDLIFLKNFKIIRTGSVSGTLQVTYVDGPDL